MMSYTDKKIVERYTGLFDGLSADNKVNLIESLSKSLKKAKKSSEKAFYGSFGALGSSKPAEKIIKEIRASRKFRTKEIAL